MNIIYISCLCSNSKFKELSKNSNIALGNAVQKYHRLLVDGFMRNNLEVNTVTAIPITRLSNKETYINSNQECECGINYNYLSVINIPILKNIHTIIASFFKTMKLSLGNKNSVIICDVLNISVAIGGLLAAKILRRKNIGIVTDIPNFLSKNNKRLSVKVNNFLMNSFSSYVFLTEEMKNVVNCRNKKYVVIEGQVDNSMKDSINSLENKYEKKVCIYAGGIHKIYGIKNLVDSFIKADINNTELHIYGSGDFENELKLICTDNNKVKYFGIRDNEYIVKEELKATLLINPRPTNEEYTKYSFPSKNMEYMVSGTPVLTTKLPGMPEEYNDYVYLIEDESVEGLKKTLIDVLNRSDLELYTKGARAKEFVLSEKNNIKQVKKIIDMINNYIKEDKYEKSIW